ncbi:MAG: hypothetical protein ACOH1T_01215 [Microbacteriaceae bacterium]
MRHPPARAAAGCLAAATAFAILGIAAPAAADVPGAEPPRSVIAQGVTQQIADVALASIPSWVTAIERGHIDAAIAAVHPGSTVLSSVAPGANTYSVGFDDGQNSPSGLADYFGTRAAIVTVTEGTILTRSGIVVTCSLDEIISASTFLASVGADMTCPTATPAGPSAITSAWAWGNSVDPLDDNRGLGQPGMAPAALAAFATARGLEHVNLSVPWASNEGALAVWVADCLAALHAEGITVAALGGDNEWLDDPTLAARWVSDALDAADFDAVQFDVEPWNTPAEPDWSIVTPRYVAMLDAARAEAQGASIGIDAPWWLTTKTSGTGTVFDALLAAADTVAIVTFADHANGAGGIIPLSADAVASAATAGVPFTIGVETDTPAVAGGAEFTFYDDGAAALETETATVRAHYAATTGYRGVTVEHVLAWAALAP